VVWAALIIGLCCGVVFLGSGFAVRWGRVRERLVELWSSPREERPDPGEARALAEGLGMFDSLREELLLRARRAKLEHDLDVELDAFRTASDRFLHLAGHESRSDEED
jgi:hypothetical protein